VNTLWTAFEADSSHHILLMRQVPGLRPAIDSGAATDG